jgi:Cu(I)/Ag(I) efflux system membrane fusion protein
VIRFLKQHPWRSSALAVVVIAVALAVVIYVRREAPSNEHANHSQTVAAPTNPHAGHEAAAMPKGYVPVALTAAQASAMGLTTALVAERDFNRTVRTVGVVTVDETRTAHVHSRVRGWIEGFHVQFVGRKVRKGERLLSLYSQEVYAAQMELVSLLRSSVKSPELLEAARDRLALWEVPRATIAKIEETGEPQRTFPVLAPLAGVVVAKQAFEGQFIDPSIELYTISDLSRVWVFADIYEADVANVRLGSTARLTVEGQREPIEAKVGFLNPTIDERTRTRKARFEVKNTTGEIMPGAFVTVELELEADRGLAVPESAVIRTGERAIVFVAHGTHIVPREVKLGTRLGDYFRVESGLDAGEHVATGAQFLLDSESRLRATGGGGGGGHAGH